MRRRKLSGETEGGRVLLLRIGERQWKRKPKWKALIGLLTLLTGLYFYSLKETVKRQARGPESTWKVTRTATGYINTEISRSVYWKLVSWGRGSCLPYQGTKW